MSNHISRMGVELYDLEQRLQRLGAFIGTEAWKELPDHEKALLVRQQEAMNDYRGILDERLRLAQNHGKT